MDLASALAAHNLSQFDRTLSALSGLRPEYQADYVDLIGALAAAGLDPVAVQGLRTIEEQQALYDSGRGVTRAPGGRSYHNYGAALDIVPAALLAQSDWAPNDPRWQQMGEIVSGYPQFEWGGAWQSIYDPSHVQIAGTSISDLAAGHAHPPPARAPEAAPPASALTAPPIAAPLPGSTPGAAPPVRIPDLPWLDPWLVANAIRSSGRGLVWQEPRRTPAFAEAGLTPLARMFG